MVENPSSTPDNDGTSTTQMKSTSTNGSGGGSGGGNNSGTTNVKKTEGQMAKLKDANAKYKSLLKMAKERIQAQEDELETLQDELEKAKNEKQSIASSSSYNGYNDNAIDGSSNSGTTAIAGGVNGHVESTIFHSLDYDCITPTSASLSISAGGGGSTTAASSPDNSNINCSIVRVCQRIKMELGGNHQSSISSNGNNNSLEQVNGHTSESNNNNSDNKETTPQYQIWALIEYEITDNSDTIPTNHTINNETPERFQRWRRFPTDSSLLDHIRKDSGEPISLPPYSLTPYQSQQMEEEARLAVAHITEEFRRFRVRAEVARKQTDATVRSLQSNNVQSAQAQIEGEDLASELEQARTDHEELQLLKNDMIEQEAQWKAAYDVILKENNALRSSGSEALLAAQWRQRYEVTLAEKEDLEMKLEMEVEKVEKIVHMRKKEDAGRYESKYKDLKESFRLYRKKAKEIFEAQQRGEVAMLGLDTGAEEAKLSYLRNLMVNYLTSDPTVREHMEGAIGTVLKFSSEDISKIAERKLSSDSWFK